MQGEFLFIPKEYEQKVFTLSLNKIDKTITVVTRQFDKLHKSN